MIKEQQQAYQNVEELKKIIRKLKGRKFELSCGHRVTFGYFLGADITIRNGANPEITCSMCGY